jgi:hypothetical protein
MEIPFRDDNWGLAVDLNSLIRTASDASLCLHSVSVNPESEHYKIKLQSDLKLLDQQMHSIKLSFKRLGIKEIVTKEAE